MVEDYEILYIFRDALAEAEEKIDVRLKVMPYRKCHIVFLCIELVYSSDVPKLKQKMNFFIGVLSFS